MLRKLKASVTVEASMIVPLLFFTIVALLFLNLFEYNRVKLYVSLILTGEHIHEEGKQIKQLPEPAEMEKRLESNLAEGFLMCTTQYNLTNSMRNKVGIKASLAMNYLQGGLLNRLTAKISHYDCSIAVEYTDRERILRCIAAGEQVWDKVVKSNAD